MYRRLSVSSTERELDNYSVKEAGHRDGTASLFSDEGARISKGWRQAGRKYDQMEGMGFRV